MNEEIENALQIIKELEEEIAQQNYDIIDIIQRVKSMVDINTRYRARLNALKKYFEAEEKKYREYEEQRMIEEQEGGLSEEQEPVIDEYTKIIDDVNKLTNKRDRQVYTDLIQPIRIARFFGNEEPELPHVDEIMKKYGIGSPTTYDRMKNRIVDKIPETEWILIRRATRSDKGKKRSKDG